MIVIFCTYKSEVEIWFQSICFGKDQNIYFPVKLTVVATYYVSTRTIKYVCPLLLILFYVQQCFLLSQYLKEQRHYSSLKQISVPCFIRDYNFLHKTILLAESALSLQIFWLISSLFTSLFVLFSATLRFNSSSSLIVDLEYIIFAALQGISFFVVIFFAAQVNEEDEELRHEVKDIAFQLKQWKRTEKSYETLFLFLESKRPLALTASGLFQFKKNLLLTSAGILITYNLLMLQLDRIYFA
ncbi:hypothetical protein AVEN_185110-1 [Araneus ventricosus]|uniref:Gustatory receptor n=1 Tax=Araneus ventricosus TaxID=182803 RepID=A0A4Y2MSK3_ARAVE|nr:hypothetical protein AVEN_185110-1 [Araneus ventricosus]